MYQCTTQYQKPLQPGVRIEEASCAGACILAPPRSQVLGTRLKKLQSACRGKENTYANTVFAITSPVDCGAVDRFLSAVLGPARKSAHRTVRQAQAGSKEENWKTTVKDYTAILKKAGSEQQATVWESQTGPKLYAVVWYSAKWKDIGEDDPKLKNSVSRKSVRYSRV